MSFIEKSVARLDQLERLETLALELGKSHFRYNAPPKYYGVKIILNIISGHGFIQMKRKYILIIV